MKKGYLAILAFAVLGALAVAGCGSSNDTTGESSSGGGGSAAAYGGGESSSTAASEEGASTGGETTFVSTAKAGDLGQVIVDSEGMTLYDFHKDKGTTSSCYGSCEKAWPPVTTSGEAQSKAAPRRRCSARPNAKTGRCR